MRKVLVITLIFLTSLFTSCERQDTPDLSSFDCADCFQQKPEYVRLNVKVTINDQNPYVLLKIYIGNYEDGQLDWKDTTYYENYWVDVVPDRYYSVKAEYKDGSKLIYAIDGDEVKLKYTETKCDAGCYYKVGGDIDVRLRD